MTIECQTIANRLKDRDILKYFIMWYLWHSRQNILSKLFFCDAMIHLRFADRFFLLCAFNKLILNICHHSAIKIPAECLALFRLKSPYNKKSFDPLDAHNSIYQLNGIKSLEYKSHATVVCSFCIFSIILRFSHRKVIIWRFFRNDKFFR